jgi:predicted house-cleaning noncanonical NTP pyrophosphatase (MazG superfamily)
MLNKLFDDFADWRKSPRYRYPEWEDYIRKHREWEKRLEDALRETINKPGLNGEVEKLSAYLEVVRSDFVGIVESLKNERTQYELRLNKVQNLIKAWDLERENGGVKRTAQRADHMGLVEVETIELNKVIAALKELGVQDD